MDSGSGEIGVGVVGTAGQRTRRDKPKAFGAGEGSVFGELVRRDEGLDCGVLDGGLQVLADGQEVDIGDAQVVHDLHELGAGLAETDHQAGFGEYFRCPAFDLIEQAQ